jgi:hypothetical protein
MPLTWQEDLRVVLAGFHAVTTPARDLWHGRILRAEGLSGEDAAWRRIAEHEHLARKPIVATDCSVPELGLGRFFGDRSGFSLFRGQADAAFRCLLRGGLVEFEEPADIPTRDCSTYWLDIVYQIAEHLDDGGALFARERTVHSPGEPWKGCRGPADSLYSVTFDFLERDVFTSSIAAIESILRGQDATDLDDEDTSIPPERRTRPLGIAEAARLMGYGGGRKAGEKLRKAMGHGAVQFKKLTRQSYVFDLNDFPQASHAKVTPTHPK